jgi:hypothetical protein
MMSGRPDGSQPGLPRVDQASGRFCRPDPASAQVWEIDVSSKTRGRSREFRGYLEANVTADVPQERRGVEILHSVRKLCYHQPLSAIEPRRFESGDPTPGGARLHRTERRMVLGMAVPLSRSRPAPCGEGRVFSFFITESSHSIQEAYEWRRSRHETDPNL